MLPAAEGGGEHRTFLIIAVIINPLNSFKDKNLIKLRGQVIYGRWRSAEYPVNGFSLFFKTFN